MQPSSSRLVCRAHNRFSPSTALWQHFIVPNRPLLHHGRHSSSFVTATARGQETNDTGIRSSSAHHLPEQPDVQPQTDQPQKPIFRKLTTSKGKFARSPRTVSKASNFRRGLDAQEEALIRIERLLVDTKALYEQNGDYEGVVIKPDWHQHVTREKRLPWIIPQEERSAGRSETLNREIELFYEYMKPNRFENIARKHLIEQVRTHVREKHPNYILEVFGSERTGIAFATSDIDLRLVHKSDVLRPSIDAIEAQKPPKRENRERLRSLLQQIWWSNLSKRPEYVDTKMLHARYPLISLHDRKSGLDVQIVLANDTSISRSYMEKYMAEYPYLRPVYFVIKAMFDVRGLSNVFRGGFGSYTLFMMLVASIQHMPNQRNDASGALFGFLRFWRNFDTTTHGVSIDPVELYEKNVSKDIMPPKARDRLEAGRLRPLPSFILSLRDPADETNDLGRKGIAIKHVQATLQYLCEQLGVGVRYMSRPSLLGPLVGPTYSLNIPRRHKLEGYGRKLSTEMQLSLAAIAKSIREADGASTDADNASTDADVTSTGVDDASTDVDGASTDAVPRVQVEDEMEGLPGMESETEAAQKESTRPVN